MVVVRLIVAALLLAAQAQRGVALAAMPVSAASPTEGEESAEPGDTLAGESACFEQYVAPQTRGPRVRVVQRAPESTALLRVGFEGPRAGLLVRRRARGRSDDPPPGA